MKYIKSFKIFESKDINWSLIIPFLQVGYSNIPEELSDLFIEKEFKKDGILRLDVCMFILRKYNLLSLSTDVMCNNFIEADDDIEHGVNKYQFYVLKEISKDIVNPISELYDKIEEFEIFKDDCVIDSISLNHLYDYYGCILNIEEFENIKGCEVH